MLAKQERFVDEYLVDLNATQAAIRAGYSARGVEVTSWKLLRNAKVQAAIAQRRLALQEEVQVRQVDVIKEYLCLALSDMRKAAQWGPDGVELVDSTLLDDQTARAVQEVTSTKRSKTFMDAEGNTHTTVEVNTKVKLYNKQAALRDLAEHLNLFGQGKGVLDETFLLGFVEVVKQHASDGETRQAIIGYLRHYLGAAAA